LRIKLRGLAETAGQSNRHPEGGEYRTSTWHIRGYDRGR